MLGHLPGGHTAEEVRDVLVPLIGSLRGHLRGSLTWDQGCEMAAHKQFSVATGVPVAQELNGRPRKTLGWETPAERLRDLLTAT
jgi:IS30 family transposase